MWMLRGLNYKFWSHDVRCSETKASVLPHNIIALGFYVEKYLLKKYIHMCAEDCILLFQHLSTVLLKSLKALIWGLFYLFRGQIVLSYVRGLVWQASRAVWSFHEGIPLGIVHDFSMCHSFTIYGSCSLFCSLLSLHKTKKVLYINDHNCDLCTLFFAELSLKFCS